MSNAQNTETNRGREAISKLAPANFLPRRIHGLDEAVQELVCGSLIGIVDGIKTGSRTDAMTGEVSDYLAFTGQFEYVDNDPKRAVMSSGVMFMPGGFEGLLKDAAIEADKNGGRMEIAYVIKVFRAKNPQGYSWKIEPLMEIAVENDPLAKLRALSAPKLAALPAPKIDEAKAADEAKARDEAQAKADKAKAA